MLHASILAGTVHVQTDAEECFTQRDREINKKEEIEKHSERE